MVLTSTGPVPTAWHVRGRIGLALAALPLITGIAWGTYHLAAAIAQVTGRGSPLAVTWLAAFSLLWWVGLAWTERPTTATPRTSRRLAELVVTVQVPVYNEDERLLAECLSSLFEQTRRPNRIRVVDDGSTIDGAALTYDAVREWFLTICSQHGIVGTWDRTVNRGKRHAQMHVLADDPGDVFVTLDSDSVLERTAIAEGLIPFKDPRVQSVAGMVLVRNSRSNMLARLTCMLYVPFTRGFRSAMSQLGRVTVNSGTLAFYRGETIRKYAHAYPRERFMGHEMQMNDDSMMTFYGLLEGRTVHQPSAVAFTVVPEGFRQYVRQQQRWMRGTFVRTWWWIRYMRFRDPAFWLPLAEFYGFVLSALIMGAVVIGGVTVRDNRASFLLTTAMVALLVNYTVALRYFVIRRSDEPLMAQCGIFLLAPLAGIWRMFVLRPLMMYCYATFWKVGSWGTRADEGAR